MGLTPLDIQKKKFGKTIRGFSEVEVENFLEEVATHCTDMTREICEQKDLIRALKIRISELEEREKTVNETLSVVRKLSEDMKESAKKQSDTIISQAKNTAKEIYLKLQDEIRGQKSEIAHLRIKKNDLKNSLINFLRHQISLLENQEPENPETESECHHEAPGISEHMFSRSETNSAKSEC